MARKEIPHRARAVRFLAGLAMLSLAGCSNLAGTEDDPGTPGDPGQGDGTDGGTGNGDGGGGDYGDVGGTGSAGQFGRIYHSDLTYLGAFKCPDKKLFAFAKGKLAWHPTANQLIAVGKSFDMMTVPQPVISATETPGDLNWAVTPSGSSFDPLSQLAPSLGPATKLGGLTWHKGRIWMGLYEYYNVAGRDNLGIVTTDENWGDPRGAWRVGPTGTNNPVADLFHANKTHCDVMELPKDWADAYAPGRELAGGRTRGAGAFGSGKGPHLYAFEANAAAVPGQALNGVCLMAFGENSHTFPGYRNSDRYHSIWIWKGNRHAVITGARKGLGPNHYGPGTTCTPDKGWHAEPYEPRMYFFDVDELGEVALGNRLPYDMRPYEEVMPTEMWGDPTDASYDPGCKQDWFIGWAWDPQNSILYASQPRAFKVPGPSNRMIVHMWRVN